MNKKDAYYFSHDCNAQDDPKCMMLIDDLGMEGYGIFWALIEKLRAEKDYTLPLSICCRFARRWATSEAKIHAVVTQYGLFEIDNDMFFSLRLKRSMEEKSSRAKISAEARWSKNQRLTAQNLCNRIPIACDRNANGMQNDAIKVKESKVNIEYMSDESDERLPVQNEMKEPHTVGYCERFEKFWEYYGRKGNKKLAYNQWKKLNEDQIRQIGKNIRAYINSTPDMQFRKDAQVYLNTAKEHWNDLIVERSGSAVKVENAQVTQKAVFYAPL